jgi:hypothetical protein
MNQLWREQPNKTYRWQSKNSKRTAYFRSKKDALEYSHFALNNLEFDLVGNLFESLKETPFSKQLQAGDIISFIDCQIENFNQQRQRKMYVNH